MKKYQNYLISLIIILTLSSCTYYPNKYYQLFEMRSNSLQNTNNSLKFENDDVIIQYNLWSNYGTSTFSIMNKTNFDIEVDLRNSHLVVNDHAKTYYVNKTFTSSVSSSTENSNQYFSKENWVNTVFGNGLLKNSSSSTQSNTSQSISTIEEHTIIIPSKAYKIINGFDLTDDIQRNCNLLRFPNPIKGKDVATLNYIESDSPLKIVNIIRYKKSSNNESIDVKNSFWLASLSNYPINLFIIKTKEDFCGQEYETDYYKYHSPNSFFIIYTKSMNSFKY